MGSNKVKQEQIERELTVYIGEDDAGENWRYAVLSAGESDRCTGNSVYEGNLDLVAPTQWRFRTSNR